MSIPVRQDYRYPAKVGACYSIVGKCSNCGQDVCGTFTKGEEANSRWGAGRTCPTCGCRTVRFSPGRIR